MIAENDSSRGFVGLCFYRCKEPVDSRHKKYIRRVYLELRSPFLDRYEQANLVCPIDLPPLRANAAFQIIPRTRTKIAEATQHHLRHDGAWQSSGHEPVLRYRDYGVLDLEKDAEIV